MTSEAEAVIGLYRRHAAAWDRDRGRSLFERQWLDRFLALLPPAGSILDIGCGAGEPIARHFVESGYRVTGIDTSAPLVHLCRSRFPGHEWCIADMRHLLLGRRFDGLVAWDSFFHLCPDDQRGMFPLFRRHAAPGAALLFTSGPAFGVAIGEYQGEPLYHGSLDPAEYRRLLDDYGFAVADHAAEDPTCGGHTVWLARLQ